MMVDAFSLQGSLPDQLPIVEKSTTHTEEEPLKALPPKVTEKGRSRLQAILKTKHPVSNRYFTAGVKITKNIVRDLQKEQSPFEYPKAIEEFAHKVMNKHWRNDERIKELEKGVSHRPSYKGRQRKDLLNRLYIPEPRIVGGKSAVGMDPNYYNVVDGRPIPDRLSVRQYIDTVRESLRTKIITGFREDDIMLIDETLKLEQKIIDTIKENLQNYINAFEEFLIIDHETAMTLLQEGESASKAAYNKYAEHKAMQQKYASLRSSLYNVEAKWRMCKTYQKFLYGVSPLTWRMQQEEARKSRRTSIYMMEQNRDDMAGIFGSYRLSLVQKGVSLEDIINEFREEIWMDKPAQLYFTHPDQLLEVFRFTEMQNLNALLHTEELAMPLTKIKGNMATAVRIFDKEIKHMQEIIDTLEKSISWEEQRVMYLDQLAVRLIDTELRDLLRDEKMLNLSVYVEDLYEATVGSNDAGNTIWEMMKSIEDVYRHELLLLDKVPRQEVARLEGNYYQEEMLVMRLAERAAKQHDELVRLTMDLKKSYAPPPPPRKRVLRNRCAPLRLPLNIPEPPRTLTQNELDYLDHFTTFCEYKDDPRNFGIDTRPIDRTEVNTDQEKNSARKR